MIAEEPERTYDNKMYGLIAQEVKQAMDTHNITDFAGWDETEMVYKAFHKKCLYIL